MEEITTLDYATKQKKRFSNWKLAGLTGLVYFSASSFTPVNSFIGRNAFRDKDDLKYLIQAESEIVRDSVLVAGTILSALALYSWRLQ